MFKVELQILKVLIRRKLMVHNNAFCGVCTHINTSIIYSPYKYGLMKAFASPSLCNTSLDPLCISVVLRAL